MPLSETIDTVSLAGQDFYRYGDDLFPAYLNHGNAMQFIKHVAQRWCAGKGIDVGADQWPFPGAIPIRNEPGASALKLDSIEDGSLDYVFSSHCLEHLDEPADAIALWATKLRTGGVVFLYLPHETMALWRPGAPWVRGGHKWVPTVAKLVPMLDQAGLDIRDVNYGRDAYWSFHIVGSKP